MTEAVIEVLHPGALTTIQDLGRPGHAHLGISRSGAADVRSLRLANRLLENRADCACLESTLVGPRLKFLGDCRIAITGAPLQPKLDGKPLPMNVAVDVPAGATLRVGNATAGLRSYIAFAGGVEAELDYGSRASDLRSGIGPPKLTAGDRLTVGAVMPDDQPTRTPEVVSSEEHSGEAIEIPSEPVLHVVLGPRDQHFTAAAIGTLLSAPFTVSADCDRTGVRLKGPALEREQPGELRSEGIAPGAVQVPSDGQPIVMLADHPTTGGYPVIAVVSTEDLWKVGQLRPGVTVRFVVAGR